MEIAETPTQAPNIGLNGVFHKLKSDGQLARDLPSQVLLHIILRASWSR